MIRKFIIASLLVVGGPAFAHSKSTDMTCAAAANTVASQGAVVLYYGDGLYDRFVAHQGHCERDEVAAPAWIPTADNAQCFVGYTCEQRNDSGAN